MQNELIVDSVSLRKDGDYYIDLGTGHLYTPADPVFGAAYELQARGYALTIDAQTGELASISDPADNTLFFEDDRIYSNTSSGIQFLRDARGRIREISDPLGRTVRYEYDGNGNLRTFVNQLEENATHHYSDPEAHLLSQVTTSEGQLGNWIEYDSSGRAIRQTDPLGRVTEFAYDANGKTQTVSSPEGHVFVYQSDTQGNVISVTGPDSVQHEWTYDSAGNETRHISPEGRTTEWQYDIRGNLLTATTPHPTSENDELYTTVYQYDALDRLTAVVEPDGTTEYRSYDPVTGDLSKVSDQDGQRIIEWKFDSLGRVTEEIDSTGTVRHAYSDDHRVMTTTEADGSLTHTYLNDVALVERITKDDEEWTFEYDARDRKLVDDYGDSGQLLYSYGYSDQWTDFYQDGLGTINRELDSGGNITGLTNPGGVSLRREFDSDGRLTTEFDNLGRQVSNREYDAFGRVSNTASEGLAPTQIKYTPDGLVATLDAGGVVTHFDYDEAERLTSQSDVFGNSWTYEYSGNSVTERDPLGNEFTVARDARATKLTNPDGTTYSVEYVQSIQQGEAANLPSRIIDESGRSRSFTYADGALTSTTDLAGNIYSISQDSSSGSLVRGISSPNGLVRAAEFDALGRTTAVIYADQSRSSLVYEADSPLPVSVTTSDEVVKSYGYSEAGNVTQVVASTGEFREFAYDGTDRLVSTEDSTGNTRYSYNAFGLPEQITYPGGAYVRYDYNQHGDLVAITAAAGPGQPEHKTEYTYDVRGFVDSVTDAAGGVTSLKYDVAGRLQERALPNGVLTTWSFDSRGMIASVTHSDTDGAVIASRSYERGPLGAPTRVTYEDSSYAVFSYDEAFRLDTETYYNAIDAVISEFDYDYDVEGRRTTVTRDGAAETYSYDGFRLESVTSEDIDTFFSHDELGRVISVDKAGVDNDLNVEFDAFNQITSIRDHEQSPLVSSGYDALGRKTVHVGNSAKQVLVAPSGGEFESPVLTQGETDFSAWSYLGDSPLMRMTNDGPVYYLSDAMGSIIGLTDNNGLYGTTRYDSYGNVLNTTGLMAATPEFLDGEFGFHGGWADPDTGLIQFRARAYDPETGLFLSRDAGDIVESEIESFNPYQFTFNNPNYYTDPTGNFTIAGISVSMGAQNNARAQNQSAQLGAKHYIEQELKEAIVDQIFDTISNWIADAIIDSVVDAAGGAAGAGTFFEYEAVLSACNALNNADWIHLYPVLSGDGGYLNPRHGDGLTNGLECSLRSAVTTTLEVLRGLGGSNRRVPDFILGNSDVDKNRPHSNWATADFKLSLSTAVKAWNRTNGYRKEQLEVFASNARKYNFIPLVAVIAVWQGGRKGADYQKNLAELGKLSLFHTVAMIAVALAGGSHGTDEISDALDRVFG